MASSSKAKSFSAETKFVKELTAILDESNLTELEFESEDISVRLARGTTCLLYTSPSPRDVEESRMPSSA